MIMTLLNFMVQAENVRAACDASETAIKADLDAAYAESQQMLVELQAQIDAILSP